MSTPTGYFVAGRRHWPIGGDALSRLFGVRDVGGRTRLVSCPPVALQVARRWSPLRLATGVGADAQPPLDLKIGAPPALGGC